ncbi:hypothetical protein NIE79_003428 [Micromonospora sp. NIE79]|uniref:Uncharacterized protein n=1 Tax=Micromonospora trifolii TaxID=2911208 RepID=A0ABS9N5S1_9ACTN|nr:hypothetical protein [Micromonospora trifolii]MCG5444985.1 hypothetical protein [Micromonospora trifolii]
MDALLAKVIERHGGLDRWNTASTLTTRLTYGGPFWAFKGRPDFDSTELVEADLHRERIRHVQEGTGQVTEYDIDTDRVTVTAADGSLIDELTNPRASFAGYTGESQWSLAQAAYFRGYATWHYLVEPFLFTWPGVEAREVEPWTEDGESWRVLRVTFPESLHTHTDTQLYYFDDGGLLRRMDYQPVVNGSSRVAHYVSGATEVDGLVVPTRRRIHLRQEDNTPDLSWTPITLDLADVRIR